MTSLDPSHFPFLAHDGNDRTGQATHSSVEPLHETSQRTKDKRAESSDDDSDAEVEEQVTGQPSWKGAWARRQAAHKEQKEQRERDERKRGKIPVPPIPDLRYEQGILLSIRPFLHRLNQPNKRAKVGKVETEEEIEEKEEKQEAQEKGAMVSESLTAEGVREGEENDLFTSPLRIEWGSVSWVILRDQVIYPCLQGALWGAAGLWLANLWDWNKARRASASGSRGPVGPGLLAKLGVRTR